MKCRVLKAVAVTAMIGMSVSSLAQKKNYYVVVGAISSDGVAKEFTTHLPSMNADTAYAMNTSDDIVQLYVMHTTSEEVAIAKTMQLKNDVETSGGQVSGNYESVTIFNSPEGKLVTANQGIVSKPDFVADASGSKPAGNERLTGSSPARTNSKLLKFTISNPIGQKLPGRIHYVDFDREKELTSYPAATYTDLIPAVKSEDVALVCGIFGYKIAEKYVDSSDPSQIEGAFEDESGAWVIPYDLERLERGDVSVMYNVSFHKDAVVMLPPSKGDLDELVTMMKENPYYEITVHGHCNGKNDRKMIVLNNRNDLFSVEGSKHFFGPAKLLSELRAEAVRDYLVKNGIEKKRIRTYAWGGRYMLAEPESRYAKLNDRIEIEVRKD